MSKRAAIYARISRKDKRVPKVEHQIALCESIAAGEGWTVDPAHIFQDDGIAASGREIDDTTIENRPGARALLSAMRAGSFDVLIAVEGERLARTYLDGIEFIQASDKGGVTWFLETDGPLDPSSPAGEETAVSIFASGRREGRVRGVRQRRRYDRERAAGMPLWGARPFGWEPDRITARADEADLIRSAVADYLGGERSLLRIAKDWNAAGVKTDGMMRERKGRDGITRQPRGLWTATTVRQLLLRDRNAGRLVHRGVELPQSQIEAIITRVQLDSLRSRIKSGTPVGERAQTLLGGLIRCECGAPMHGTVGYSQRKGGTRHEYKHYKCSQTLYDKTRRHATIVQAMADDLIIAMLWADLYSGKLTVPGDDIASALESVTARLAANSESRDHVGSVLIDRRQKSIHGQALGSLATLDIEREALELERDGLVARAAEGGALAAFLTEWRQSPAGFNDTAERDAWQGRFWALWEGIPIERKHAMIRARYRPVVKVGGRGPARISLSELPGTTTQRRD
ncbi:recombinase family protein [Microbacterium sp. NPDC055357]